MSIYNAKCLTLPRNRQGRVLFAGDAGHLVPIFGVRGLNSGLDAAANLAWKLALVQRCEAADSLLDSYSVERLQATCENLLYGAKSTEFMAPANYGFWLMRAAALRLSVENATVCALLNPRQSTRVEYAGSPLNLLPKLDDPNCWVRAGMPAAEALLLADSGQVYITSYFGNGFRVLYFSEHAVLAANLIALERSGARVICIARHGEPSARVLMDHTGQAWVSYGAVGARFFWFGLTGI